MFGGSVIKVLDGVCFTYTDRVFHNVTGITFIGSSQMYLSHMSEALRNWMLNLLINIFFPWRISLLGQLYSSWISWSSCHSNVIYPVHHFGDVVCHANTTHHLMGNWACWRTIFHCLCNLHANKAKAPSWPIKRFGSTACFSPLYVFLPKIDSRKIEKVIHWPIDRVSWITELSPMRVADFSRSSTFFILKVVPLLSMQMVLFFFSFFHNFFLGQWSVTWNWQ